MFRNLKYLNFDTPVKNRLSFGMTPPSVFSSTLLELHVAVGSDYDCLYLLDGRFDQLHTFHINICSSSPSSAAIFGSNVSYSY